MEGAEQPLELLRKKINSLSDEGLSKAKKTILLGALNEWNIKLDVHYEAYLGQDEINWEDKREN